VRHTPGPWRVNDWGEPEYLDGMRAQYTIEARGDDRTAVVFEQDDARLIAAAPELLEALVGLVDYHDTDEEELPEVTAARVAITKATK